MKLFDLPLFPNLATLLIVISVAGCSTANTGINQGEISGPEVNEREELVEEKPEITQNENTLGDLSSVQEPVKILEGTDDIEQQEIAPTPRPSPTSTVEPAEQVTLENTLLTQLGSLRIEPEYEATPYDRSEFPHWDDEDGDGMNTRLEILSLEKVGDVGWYSRWDGEWYAGEGGLSAPRFDIDHIVSLKEAWRSGADEWSASDKDTFADDMLNLTAVTASSNRSKGAKDASEWLPSEPSGKCYLLIRVIQVKTKWSLSIDQGEYTTLKELTESCGPDIPDIPSPPPDLSSSASTPTPTASPAQPSSGYGSQFYQTADGSDIDIYDANGNGDINCGELPSAAKPVLVISPGSDPYRLDGDGDGFGCEG
ncbi:MAG: GmrSD restriction endonuclease domain-containing protein [Acidimicrobiales bacterium]